MTVLRNAVAVRILDRQGNDLAFGAVDLLHPVPVEPVGIPGTIRRLYQ